MMTPPTTLVVVVLVVLLLGPRSIIALTDPSDAAALRVMFQSLNYPRQLNKWTANGGDPCGENWKGVKCSGSRVTEIDISTLGLSGSNLGYQLTSLTSLKNFDISNNNLGNHIPYNLPPNLERLNVSGCGFSGSLPYSISLMTSLKYLNLTGNNFTRPLPAELLAKSKKGSLFMSIEAIGDQDKGYCLNGSCKTKKHTKVVIPVIVAILIVIVLSIAFVIVWKYKWRKTKDSTIKDTTFQPRNKQYTYYEVQSITGNFTTVIGKGGFGTVYRGSIGGNQVAVKMLSEFSSQGHKEFNTEIKLLMDIRHKNITPLVGYCNDNNHKAIIYEYMANGNLRQHLFDENSNVLSWERRLQIGCDAAEGLVYMHHGCRPPIVHRDVKSTNILLNKGLEAKLADFGMSRAFTTEDATHEFTKVAGTFGYLDPEYHSSHRLTLKSDVYSFGVVLLELITGRRAISENMHISNWVKSTVAKGNVENIIDPRLQGNFNKDAALKVVELAIACVSNKSNDRPTMNNVAMELKNCLPADQTQSRIPNIQSTSLNFETMSDLEPR